MNANELADALEEIGTTEVVMCDAATMLRQQQAEIESMQERMIVAEKELNHMRSFFGCDPAYYGMTSAEPVAWMVKTLDGKNLMLYGEEPPPKFTGEVQYIPLYEHSEKTLSDVEFDNIFANGKRLGVLETEDKFRKEKTLTDDEIDELWDKYLRVRDEYGEELQILGVHDFARAILKKASEK
jgi:hypothetical protein